MRSEEPAGYFVGDFLSSMSVCSKDETGAEALPEPLDDHDLFQRMNMVHNALSIPHAWLGQHKLSSTFFARAVCRIVHTAEDKFHPCSIAETI